MDRELCIAICEDDQDSLMQLEALIQCSSFFTSMTAFQNGGELLNDYSPGRFHLIFMDIYMDGQNGVETTRSLRQLDPHIPIVFVTSSPDHALDGYRLGVSRYIEKPVSKEAVEDALSLAFQYRSLSQETVLIVGTRELSLPTEQLLLVEQDAHYLVFSLTHGRMLRTKGRLDQLDPQLSSFSFFRCHKSYLVNLAFVTDFDKESKIFRLKGGKIVPIRRESLKAARDTWENWLFQLTRNGGPIL